MRNFFSIVSFEYKKICKRKSSAAAIIVLILVSILNIWIVVLDNGAPIINGKRMESDAEKFAKDREYAKVLAGPEY